MNIALYITFSITCLVTEIEVGDGTFYKTFEGGLEVNFGRIIRNQTIGLIKGATKFWDFSGKYNNEGSLGWYDFFNDY